MTFAVIAFLSVALVALGVYEVLAYRAFAELKRRPPDILTERQRSKVVLTLKTGEGFLGVLYAHDARAVVLRNASAIGAGEQGSDQTVDGELLVLREDVSYLQVL